MKAALIHLDRQTDKHKAKCRLCNYANSPKNSRDSRRVRRTKHHFGCAWIKGVKKQSLFCYLPLQVFQDVYNSQLHDILSHKLHGVRFVQIAQRTSTEISEEHFFVILWTYIFQNLHLFLPQTLMKKILSGATVKFALDRFKHGRRIKFELTRVTWSGNFKTE